MTNVKTAKCTEIQFFDNTHEVQVSEFDSKTVVEYSANLKIEIDGKTFCAQWSGKDNEAHSLTIPSSEECFWGTEEVQDWACENIDECELEKVLEEQGHENNFGYLEEHGEKM